VNELRWILLLAGLVFLIALAAWETHRSRRAAAPREPFPHFEHEKRLEPATPIESATREPPLGELPEGLVDSPHLDGAAVEPISAQRGVPMQELPRMSAVRRGGALAETAPAETTLAETAPADTASAETTLAEPRSGEPANGIEALAAPTEPSPQGPAEISAATPARLAPGASVVDWPAEAERHIISLRIVSSAEQRLSGRAARQALAACGFVHGRYGIFHQPAEDGRALLSCASLNKPGSFDPASMDFQRFSGLSLFTVLPGPLPASATLDRLLEAARDLSHRLQARLLDDQNQPLDAARITALRSSVQQQARGADPAAAGGGPGA